MTLSTLGNNAQNVLIAVCIIQAIAAAVFFFAGFRHVIERRDHFMVTTMIVATAALSYYAMATGQGRLDVPIQHPGNTTLGSTLDFSDMLDKKHHLATRPVFYARYIDWSITTPLLLIDVLLIAQLPVTAMAWAIFADIAMVVTGLIAAFVTDGYRWGWFVAGCFFMVAIFIVLYGDGAAHLARRDSSLLGFYNSTVLALVVLWSCYPVVWALAEGTHYFSPDVEAYMYGILDVLAKVGWGGFILFHNERLQASYARGGTGGRSEAEAPLVQNSV